MKTRLLQLLFAFLLLNPILSAKASLCEDRWVNPITDVCWRCLFPISLGNIGLNSSELPDTPIPPHPFNYAQRHHPYFSTSALRLVFGSRFP